MHCHKAYLESLKKLRDRCVGEYIISGRQDGYQSSDEVAHNAAISEITDIIDDMISRCEPE